MYNDCVPHELHYMYICISYENTFMTTYEVLIYCLYELNNSVAYMFRSEEHLLWYHKDIKVNCIQAKYVRWYLWKFNSFCLLTRSIGQLSIIYQQVAIRCHELLVPVIWNQVIWNHSCRPPTPPPPLPSHANHITNLAWRKAGTRTFSLVTPSHTSCFSKKVSFIYILFISIWQYCLQGGSFGL